MKRDIIDSLMAGGLLSFLPIWEADPVEQIVIEVGLAALSYIIILLKEKEESMHTYKVIKEDFRTAERGKRIRTITRRGPLKVGGLYAGLGTGFSGYYRVLEEIYDPWEENNGKNDQA